MLAFRYDAGRALDNITIDQAAATAHPRLGDVAALGHGTVLEVITLFYKQSLGGAPPEWMHGVNGPAYTRLCAIVVAK